MTAMIQRPPTLDRLDLLAKIHAANEDAMKLRRRGLVGTLSPGLRRQARPPELAADEAGVLRLEDYTCRWCDRTFPVVSLREWHEKYRCEVRP